MSAWPPKIDEILRGDQIVGFAYLTPAKGVVLQPLTNMGDPTEPVSSSVGMFRKLQRVQQDPHVAVAYHTRKHGFSDRPEYVLVQGIGSLTPVEDRDWVDRHREEWIRFAGPLPRNRLAAWWLREYHWRVGVQVDIERVIVWPDLACSGEPTVYGAAVPATSLPPQRPPGKGTGPRISHVRATKRAEGMPHVLLGWAGADGFPMVAPVDVRGGDDRGMLLRAPDGLMPEGGRRAGLLAHDFARYAAGQDLAKYTGWLQSLGDGEAVYAPHTRSGYRMPSSKVIFRVSSAVVTKWRTRTARRAGFIP